MFKALIYFLFFSPSNLEGYLADRQQILSRSMMTHFYEIWIRDLGDTPTKQNLAAKQHQFFSTTDDIFANSSQMSPDWNKILSIRKQHANDSRSTTCAVNLVKLGPQTEKKYRRFDTPNAQEAIVLGFAPHSSWLYKVETVPRAINHQNNVKYVCCVWRQI